jgi:hypothetical protein
MRDEATSDGDMQKIDSDFAFRFHAVMLGVLADQLRLNRRSR